MNYDRNIVKIVKEIASTENIKVTLFSDGWTIKLEKDNNIRYIYGYSFGLNDASSSMVCTDKSATYEILKDANIPAAKHHFFFKGNYKFEEIKSLLEEYKEVVLKPNDGTGGKDIYKVSNLEYLETTVDKLFSKYTFITVSPFYKISEEVRYIVLDDEVELVYEKVIPHIIGDGISSIKDLLDDKLVNTYLNDKMSTIPAKGEIVKVNWQHNLSKGAYPKVVEVNEEVLKIVLKAKKELNLRFASIDVIKENGNYKILEINSGVMMEVFSSKDSKNYETAKRIYLKAILKMFEIR